jgi:endonuclease G
MKKIFISIIFIIFSTLTFAQKVDIIIKNNILESHFSYELHVPIFVKYKLYKGGGNCSRTVEGFRFHTGNIKNSATAKDYVASGYDIGHLANAEDFAYNCKLDSQTFFFYNALPQTPNLNRGIWKHYETEIRKVSQNDSLLIICGGTFQKNNTIPNTNIHIPDYCWKVVKSLSTNKILYVLYFTNNMESNSVQTSMKLSDLETKLGYKLGL